MLIYVFTILIIGIFSALELTPLFRNEYLFCFSKFIVFVLLVFQIGLRWETGTDWEPYITQFNIVDDISTVSPLVTGQELGYNCFVWFSKVVFSNYSFFLFFHSIVFFLLIFKCAKFLNPYFFISILLIYVELIGMTGSNRQLLALVIVLYSLKYISNSNFKFLLLILLASQFHTSALLGVIYLFLNRSFSVFLICTIICIAFLLSRTAFPSFLFENIGNNLGSVAEFRVMAYSSNVIDKVSVLSLNGILRRSFILFPAIYFRKMLNAKIVYYNLVLNGYIFGVVFYFLFSESFPIFTNRGSLYFNIMEPFILASFLSIFSNMNSKYSYLVIIFLLSFVLFYISISPYPDLFDPYKGLFINSDYKRTMY